MFREYLLPPILFDQFEFVISALTGVKDCCICDIEITEAACNCFVRHCHPILPTLCCCTLPELRCIAQGNKYMIAPAPSQFGVGELELIG